MALSMDLWAQEVARMSALGAVADWDSLHDGAVAAMANYCDWMKVAISPSRLDG